MVIPYRRFGKNNRSPSSRVKGQERRTVHNILPSNRPKQVSHDSSIGIATRYALDGPGVEFRSGRDFPHPSGPALGPTQSRIQWTPGLIRQDSSTGIQTPYALDGPGVEFRSGRDFPHPSDRLGAPHSLVYHGYRVYFPGVKRPGRGVGPPTHI